MEQAKRRWNLYERRNRFRNFYFHKVIRTHIFEKYLNRDPYLPVYAGRIVMNKNRTNQWIADRIRSGTPFLVARFGNTELSVMISVLKRRLFGYIPQNEERFDEWFHRLGEGSGFFPITDPRLGERFTDLMVDSCQKVDLLAEFHCYMDDYVLNEYMKDAKVTFLNHIEPWRAEKPWTEALEGRKVLVIHPFEESIREQYAKRERLFPKANVLPAFELKTLKAVQTIAGEKDERFADWFEALEYMYTEAMKIDFDVAVLGCGAYGLPLAAKLKDSGRQAIHMGGATQILFGIKGRRWVDNPRAGILFNDAWTYPKESETPKNCQVVENHCYW